MVACNKFAVGILVLVVSGLSMLQATVIALYGVPLAGKTTVATELVKLDQRVKACSFNEFYQCNDDEMKKGIVKLCLLEMELIKPQEPIAKIDATDYVKTDRLKARFEDLFRRYWFNEKSFLFWKSVEQAEAEAKIVVVDDYPCIAAEQKHLNIKHIFVHCSFADFIDRVCKNKSRITMAKALMEYATRYRVVEDYEAKPSMVIIKEDFSRAIDCAQAESLKGGPCIDVLESEIDFVHDCCSCFECGAHCVDIALDGFPCDQVVVSTSQTLQQSAAAIIKKFFPK